MTGDNWRMAAIENIRKRTIISLNALDLSAPAHLNTIMGSSQSKDLSLSPRLLTLSHWDKNNSPEHQARPFLRDIDYSGAKKVSHHLGLQNEKQEAEKICCSVRYHFLSRCTTFGWLLHSFQVLRIEMPMEYILLLYRDEGNQKFSASYKFDAFWCR